PQQPGSGGGNPESWDAGPRSQAPVGEGAGQGAPQHQVQHGRGQQGPDGQAAGHAVEGPAQTERAQRVHHGHVALQADAGEEEGAAVQVGVEEGAGDLAQGLPEHPVVAQGVVGHPEGQGQHEDQVEGRQVRQEDVGRGGGRPGAQEVPEHGEVP
uniref:Uncharacterized protein n=1 Tax=Terrapene triunguis TaxID=2587831 RepID=A0A674JYI2_9SAUR